ncbi:phospholipase A1-like [Episyrphus balteatus]|uniref:phospholipase A1-like n=1 Tax=Episyrphus balteatus TaxID=286459 RepID=UPI002485D8CC|nr:phospholipase A1-like [Episyrphus balteatus]
MSLNTAKEKQACSDLQLKEIEKSRDRNNTLQSYPTNLNEDRWPVSQEDGSFRWVTGKDAPTENIFEKSQNDSSSDKPDRLHFYLYTQTYNASDPVEIDMYNPETLVRSTFDFRNPTAFMIHGWKDVWSSGGTGSIRNALFQNRTINFISVDWKVYSNFEVYMISQKLCSKAGKVVAQFIDWMHDNAKMRFDTLTLYGHSMGAQVAGFAGKNVKRGKVHTIVGMDPALPLFPYNDPTRRLASTDAEYVESIHTNGGYWGFYEPLGHIAFYPNGGKKQPGCESEVDGLCSHIRALEFIVEAINCPETNSFHAIKCERFEDVEEGKCDQYEIIIRMGDSSNAHGPRGIYYLETNSESPYAKGIPESLEKKQEIKKRILS